MKSKHIVATAACVALFLFQTGSWAQSTSSTAGTSTGMKGGSDHDFARKAAEGGMLEVELGRLAAQKGSTEAVRQFGQRMVDDHSKVNDRLKQIASQKGMTLPTSLDAKHRAAVQRLSKLSGERFDQAYIQEMQKDHMQDVSEFEKVSGNSSSDLKSFADETLPTLREHLASVQSMSATMGGQTSSSSTPGQHDMDSGSQSDTGTSTQPPK
jgi:putative membrane protein